ncbi:urease accessory UreF family protein [Mycobacterium sp. ACS4331]|uniref:urease accessory protein UreF n=1 Tax=Mycobacterium sp. ACS4331 TaxID=1834121 RepID=UPI0007FF09D6|nr:urease accessory UreF family protein [Mycobacterium sp. ACS4331]OBF19509.1 urease accessory protein UreF [Mycobacterium sp. ACS4331]
MSNLTTLLTLADSRLPTGGHVHSGGVEEAIASALVVDLGSLDAFLRRRIRTQGLVSASIAAAVHAERLDIHDAEAETDARTPSAPARAASRSQGRGLLRLARRVWPAGKWADLRRDPHLPVVAGMVGRITELTPTHTAMVLVYTTMTGTATAAQRLLALDPADVAALTFDLADLCEDTAAEAVTGLSDLSDPLLDVLAERHIRRDRPLFVS